ncbi:MAG: 50S ribosomal protein L6 [Rhodospirillaceae bacterium]|jgi:large subunit ribosomal protein L6|nr:50S ribosomal protein L6 [Rhodospirillaceae bacterium]MBT5565450.1 50S ribosomal protein L6 [Rhodospirillaceae bacterium]MBT6089234.1 50S ribosomal protein L6 [Rhodospirillaceae bacterium]MBT7452120.1 50S ribosomal protein L6 [Rhodospirillaceae bacterium]
MSRVGKNPIAIPDGVTVTLEGNKLIAKGKRGELSYLTAVEIETIISDNEVTVKPIGNGRRARTMWGTTRSLVENMVIGVSEGFSKTLEIQGVGYKAQAQGKKLVLSLGFSHDVNFAVPEGIEIKTPQPTQIDVSGTDRQKVGQVAAEIRAYRPPEPYKGKGVRYAGEYIIRKEGKKK